MFEYNTLICVTAVVPLNLPSAHIFISITVHPFAFCSSILKFQRLFRCTFPATVIRIFLVDSENNSVFQSLYQYFFFAVNYKLLFLSSHRYKISLKNISVYINFHNCTSVRLLYLPRSVCEYFDCLIPRHPQLQS